MDQLQATCLALLFSTQAHPVGFSALQIEEGASLASLLSVKEQQLLALHDKLQRVSLERRTIEAELTGASSVGGDGSLEVDDESQLEALERELVEARASRQLKDTVVEAMLVTNPILKTVHPDATTVSKQRSLLPLIHRRDTLSVTHANLSHAITTKLAALSDMERSYIEVRDRNRVLGERILELSERRDEEARRSQGAEHAAAENQLRRAKKMWDVTRNVAQAVVVASGVDWGRDAKLRELVLACGEDA